MTNPLLRHKLRPSLGLVLALLWWGLAPPAFSQALPSPAMVQGVENYRQGRFDLAQRQLAMALVQPQAAEHYQRALLYLTLIALARRDAEASGDYLLKLLLLAPALRQTAAITDRFPEFSGILSPLFNQRLAQIAQREQSLVERVAQPLYRRIADLEGELQRAAGNIPSPLLSTVACLNELQRRFELLATETDLDRLLAPLQAVQRQRAQQEQAERRLAQLQAAIAAQILNEGRPLAVAPLAPLAERWLALLAEIQTELRQGQQLLPFSNALSEATVRACERYRRALRIVDRGWVEVALHRLVPSLPGGWRVTTVADGVVVTPVEGLLIDQFEVSNGQFSAYSQATGRVTLAEEGFQGVSIVFIAGAQGGIARVDNLAHWRNVQGDGQRAADWEQRPVVQVTAAEAAAYCAFNGLRLPTEREWQQACQAEASAISTSNHALRFGDLQPVDSPNGRGRQLYHLLGNAAEFVSADSASRRAQLAAAGRVLTKGGSWYSNRRTLACDDVRERIAQARTNAWGFRCAVERWRIP